MNAKTAKLVNRYAASQGLPKRFVKRVFTNTPKRSRHGFKDEMRAAVFSADAHRETV